MFSFPGSAWERDVFEALPRPQAAKPRELPSPSLSLDPSRRRGSVCGSSPLRGSRLLSGRSGSAWRLLLRKIDRGLDVLPDTVDQSLLRAKSALVIQMRVLGDVQAKVEILTIVLLRPLDLVQNGCRTDAVSREPRIEMRVNRIHGVLTNVHDCDANQLIAQEESEFLGLHTAADQELPVI